MQALTERKQATVKDFSGSNGNLEPSMTVPGKMGIWPESLNVFNGMAPSAMVTISYRFDTALVVQ